MTTRGDDLTKVSVIKSLRTHTIRKVIVLQELQLEAGFDRQEKFLTALDKVSSNKSLAGPSRPSTFTGDTPATPKAWVRVRTWGLERLRRDIGRLRRDIGRLLPAELSELSGRTTKIRPLGPGSRINRQLIFRVRSAKQHYQP